jgi:hypothetical protein
MFWFVKKDTPIFQNVKFGRQHMGWLLDGFPSLFHASNTIESSNFHI